MGCGEGLAGATQRVEGARYEVVFAAVPAPIEPGRHFALDIAVCARPGVPLPDALRVDAVMPEHRHGMNYRAIVVTREAGSYRADGLMFHMPGRWDLIFDLVQSRGFGACRRVLAADGILVAGGVLSVGPPRLGPMLRWAGRLLLGLLRSRFGRRKLRTFVAKLNADDLAELAGLVAGGKVTPAIDRRYRLEQAGAAIRYVQQGRARGKVIIAIAGED